MDLSVVMPAYNEGEHIYNNLLETDRIISGFCDSFEIVCVDDGSSDNTKTEIERAANECSRIRMISYTPNGGKGHAIKTGVLEAKAMSSVFSIRIWIFPRTTSKISFPI